MCKNVVIVGDTLQLPNVVTGEDKEKLDAIVAEFDILPVMIVPETAFYSRYVLFARCPANIASGTLPLPSSYY